MRLPFYKYQATGNDFVIINQLQIPYLKYPERDVIARLCDRKYGIGADGLMLLESCADAHFRMIYYNADGRESTMCGNGGRAITHLAHHLKVFKEECTFMAIDGLHKATVADDSVSLQMTDVSQIISHGGDHVLDTGSPHYVAAREDVDQLDVYEKGQGIRYSDDFKEEGINVNFIESVKGGLLVRTYERGVEDETLSCGTGVTAAALVASQIMEPYRGKKKINIITKGGKLSVKWKESNGQYSDIWLTGPAVRVFEGVYELHQ